MQKVKLGRTNIVVNKNGFGALPVQRVSFKEAQIILRKAYENGICFFDSARAYSDSEEKIGKYLSDVRKDIYIATKTMASTVEEFWKDLQTSLEMLKTDYIDIYQFHNPSFCPKPEDGSGLYEAMLEAKKQGKIRYIGLTNHKIHIAKEAAESGLYDTIQFPFSYLASSQDLELVKICERNHVGFICMKALSGGLIHRSDIAYAYLSQFDNVLPIWGIQKESELDEFLSYQDNPPILTKEIEQIIFPCPIICDTVIPANLQRNLAFIPVIHEHIIELVPYGKPIAEHHQSGKRQALFFFPSVFSVSTKFFKKRLVIKGIPYIVFRTFSICFGQ